MRIHWIKIIIILIKRGLFVSDITFEDEKEAYSKANESMKKETKKNKILFVQADERAEELIKKLY